MGAGGVVFIDVADGLAGECGRAEEEKRRKGLTQRRNDAKEEGEERKRRGTADFADEHRLEEEMKEEEKEERKEERVWATAKPYPSMRGTKQSGYG